MLTNEGSLKSEQVFLPAARKEFSVRWGFPEFFIISQTVFPAILYLPGTQPFRLPLRMAAFGVSLGALAWWLKEHVKKKEEKHPAARWLTWVVIWLTLMIAHPTTNGLVAGLAQMMFYLAVIAPVFWVPRLVSTPNQLKRLLWILLFCNGVNSMVGVLQVYDPAHWMPQELTSIYVAKENYLMDLTYKNGQGQMVFRPPGLSDNPGAVSSAGVLAATTGLFFLISKIGWWRRGIVFGLSFVGIMAVHLSHSRTSLLIVVGVVMTYVTLVGLLQKRFFKAFLLLGIASLVLGLALFYSVQFGGEAGYKRIATLFEDEPAKVYYNNRGNQFRYALDVSFWKYPLGAGLGRWGMISFYFSDKNNPNSPLLWSELQFPSWLYDGGWLMIVLYGIALIVSVKFDLLLVMRATDVGVIDYAPMVLAINLGVIASMLGTTPFTTQVGMQYWFLAGAIFGVAKSSKNVTKNQEQYR